MQTSRCFQTASALRTPFFASVNPRGVLGARTNTGYSKSTYRRSSLVVAKANVPGVELMMTKNPVTFKPTDSIELAAATFIEQGFSHAPVVDEEGVVIGVLSETDMLFGPGLVPDSGSPYADQQKVDAKTVNDSMSTGVISVEASTHFDDAALQMLEKKIHCLPVVDSSNKVIGIITRKDILRYTWRKVMQQ